MWMALKYHRTHKDKEIRFDDRQFLAKIYSSEDPYIVVMKSTQCGISEWLIINSIGKALKGRGIFYVLPTFALAARFVRNRIDRSVSFTQYYKRIIGSSKLAKAESMMLKHIASGSIAFVGSNVAGVFTEYPADDLIIDELDYCEQDNIEMGWERLSASEDKKEIRVSNPTVEGYGIDNEYSNTNQYEWYISCECGKYIHPDFFVHVVRKTPSGKYILRDEEWDRLGSKDINLICDKCERPLNRKGAGVWGARYPGRKKIGFHVSKLFSTNVEIREIVDRFERGLTSDIIFQRFYNADLGVPFTASGAKVSDQMLDELIEDYTMAPPDGGSISIMGIDVGKVLHIVIGQLLPDKRLKTVYIGEAQNYEDIETLYKTYSVRLGVIDAMPETRLSKRVVATLKNMFMCFYGDVKKDSIDIYNKILTVERTQALDNVKEAILLKNIILPRNARTIPSYYPQMIASTRVWDEKRQRYFWTEGSKDDHYMHAEAYMILARKLLVMLMNR